MSTIIDIQEKNRAAMVTGDGIAEAVSCARRKLGLTQEEVAAKAGVSRQTVIKLERGSCGTMSLSAVARILRAVGYEFDLRHGLTGISAHAAVGASDGDCGLEEYFRREYGIG